MALALALPGPKNVQKVLRLGSDVWAAHSELQIDQAQYRIDLYEIA